ncbi:LysR family transcriptional regulator [Agarivorans sp. B2Z047]|uniref:LysR family transcriptional regulator n=1 Tax=Agarivorans sp. B2Z047 TaxID=2652721 RepID=UPI00128B6335|nr:LysR family transcriptional regulator [Agarivorans sp. B2Z047]MPW31149.1 LysR family transcriptional regulator [Agarivorans sp. B2Z047]UQN42882.1 LysR family transcriptional regulator [Agarivorans sp. B2Z047]
MLSLSIQTLECFIAAAETGAFSKAARKIGKSSSSVSRWICELEDDLGYLLFERKSNGLVVVLSPKGEALLPKAKIAIDYMRKLEDLAYSLHGDAFPLELTVSFCELIDGEGIAEVIQDLKATWPTLQIALKNIDMVHIQLAIDSNDVDFALGAYADSFYPNIGGVVVGEENISLIAHPDNPLCQEPEVQLDMLMSQTAIWSSPYEKALRNDRTLFDSVDVIECGEASTVVSLVKKNLGIALLPEYISHSAIKSGEVVALNYNQREITPSFPMMLYYRMDYPHPEVTEQVISTLKSWFGYTK